MYHVFIMFEVRLQMTTSILVYLLQFGLVSHGK